MSRARAHARGSAATERALHSSGRREGACVAKGARGPIDRAARDGAQARRHEASEPLRDKIAPRRNLAKNIVGAGVLALPAGVAAVSKSKSAAVPACGLIGVLGLI